MDITRVFDLLHRQVNEFPKKDALCGKVNGAWVKYSTDDFLHYANNISYGLMAMGIKKGDKIAIISNNRPEWNFVDFGVLQTGAILVPVYPTIAEADMHFIFNDAEVQYVFIANEDLYKKLSSALEGVKSLKDIYSFNKIKDVKNWMEIIELGKANVDELGLAKLKGNIEPADLGTLLYTSGTTGNPKGVMLSHNNIVSNFYYTRHLIPVDHTGRALSFLPLNHVYERMLTYLYMYWGISIYYAESLETIGDNLKEIQPQVFSGVPRLLEKVFDKIVAKGHELKGIKNKIFFWALALGERYELDGKNGWWYNFQLKIADKLVFVKWREALGGEVRVVVSGGAVLQVRLCRIYTAAGINVLEGYGLTETSPVIAVNNLDPNGRMFGTVGSVIEGVEVKIATDGEILCKGHNVMMGYYKHPELTTEAIDKDGYFHTGDIGEFVQNRFLKITDRKKEIFKTSGGKYIAPQAIENKLKGSSFIEQVMVIGENEKFASAFIIPAFAYVRTWASNKGLSVGKTNEELIANPEVIKAIKAEVETVNKTLGHFETIKRFELLPHEFTIDAGELTPKMSFKRKVILEKYKQQYKKIYSSND
jgi:long-chain acyl-CoA synthetase